MASPISLGEVLDLVDRGVKLYNKIKHDVPELIAEVAERIESLQLYLTRLQKFLQTDNALVKAHPTEKADLENVLSKIKVEVSEVIKILEKWKSNKGPGGLEFKFKFVAQAVFALGSSPQELEGLGKKLDRRQDQIRDWMQLLILLGQAKLMNVAGPQNPPSTSASRFDYNIIFVDPYNEGRSVVAEAYALLCKEWTVRTGGQWRIKLIHSSGLLVKSRSETATLQKEQMGMDMADGNKPPSNIAMSALFDNLPFTYSYKNSIRDRLSQRRSRGLTEDLFTTYDFVFVFNRYNLAYLENLRDVLAKKHSQSASAEKGRVVLLGEYGTTGHKEILRPRKNPDGNESLENWNTTISNIKTSFLNFLKKELQWTQPAPGAVQAD